MNWQSMTQQKARQLVAEAAHLPRSQPSTHYPEWYLKRWHFLPEGYLSRRGVTLYKAGIVPLYNVTQESALRRSMVRAVGRLRPRRVLDAGCGTGRLLASLGHAMPDVDLAGIDLSPYMLDDAAKRLDASGVEARLEHADLLAMPWDEASFDVVTAWHVPGHAPETVRPAMLAEMARVLRPGGMLLMLEHSWHRIDPGAWFRPAARRRLLGGLIILRAWRRIETGSPGQQPVRSSL